ncbi:CAF17-like 4Fe-4S cluster assembly/insertion protein YgfZ [Ketogulonicigenium vulgare]|uniref:Aminomethyl transferase family protein n=1 Tax=Ketogulonicigenium vulgare (strain WSH-001) TaxID=759362 RepID=F9Y3I0_KETVW|nr:folate-binding protein YgfZ [Ketogulonicigenium vulgare]ADO43310.1 aminomethyl transferase family protein [Ketogulonicigenium vulgare Y25]AEM41600.1 Aminomethyl transferase family protein [Ketogulonicigenium vulgare WSH-001]ALJ81716.1 aminomethyltransferase [Ketogulonicigenium vulgare]ANW34381.1 aminomethyltransferase [Ketogulonicigenium vulgare]AOZ55349.1 aminomethyl transferase family protein [Ketogulonicigenium vulgare]
MTHARKVFAITGTDRLPFLQNLVTNDVKRAEGALVYTALLTPQGKFIADFFLHEDGSRLLLDVDAGAAAALIPRLSMYRLRADVQIAETDLVVSRGTGDAPAGALADPRDPRLGWRLYGAADVSDATDWDALRVDLLVPEMGAELTGESYILENGFERLHGVDFRKGCYVGQEVTARMKHKTELRKGLARVQVVGDAAPGTVIMAGDREAGQLLTRAGDQAIAYLRFDRAGGEMTAGSARVTRLPD